MTKYTIIDNNTIWYCEITALFHTQRGDEDISEVGYGTAAESIGSLR